ncbi:unnamed protein product [Citrullus colocynthis]|uniref:Uncharacterized protein n=1 Tax=Citrullus colocynthis TaxID=252529 RepID=A0ABP0YHV2_9ROSI
MQIYLLYFFIKYGMLSLIGSSKVPKKIFESKFWDNIVAAICQKRKTQVIVTIGGGGCCIGVCSIGESKIFFFLSRVVLNRLKFCFSGLSSLICFGSSLN